MLCLCAGVAVAQTATTTVPLPIVNARVIQPGTPAEALTPTEKAQLALRNTFGPRAVGQRLILASWDQAFDDRHPWPNGIHGYGMRFGSRMGRLATANALRLSSDIAFGLEPRYDRCNCSGFLARTGHAWRRVVVARTDSGGEFPAVSNFVGSYGAQMITDQWEPDHRNTWSRKLENGSMRLAWRGASNMLREFWPDIKRKVPLFK